MQFLDTQKIIMPKNLTSRTNKLYICKLLNTSDYENENF